MKTYSVVSEILGVIRLPSDIDNLEDVISHVQHYWANSGEVRLVEHSWHCVSQTPHIIDTDY